MVAALLVAFPIVNAQNPTGRLEGAVTLSNTGSPLHNAQVMIVDLQRVTETDQEGRFRFDDVPVGAHDVIAFTASLTSPSQVATVTAGETVELTFELELTGRKDQITVTASGRQERAFDAVQSVRSLDSFDLSERMAPSIGEVLDGEPGIAKRSFGPGSSRPIIRGFDNDRVLVLQDGVRTGSLGSQSGDHGEPIDPASLERLEVVKGPATLLYGSNAIGGVVNAISGHHEIHAQAHEGVRGQVSSVVGSNGGQAGATGSIEYGTGSWLFWGQGGGQRQGDYDTPEGPIPNSKSRITTASGGGGWYGDRFFATLEYLFNDMRYGIPFAAEFEGGHEGEEGEEVEDDEEGEETIDVDGRRHWIRGSTGVRNLTGALESFQLNLSYSDYQHQEIEAIGGEEEVGTTFDNGQFVYRGVFEQQSTGQLSGRFGFWGLSRDYDVVGAEALSPPVDQNAFALFGLEEVKWERATLQLGGRLEHVRYRPQGPSTGEEPGPLPDRDFTGLSAGIGGRFDLWDGGAFVANFTSSYRAPALEELYNFGPHIGNLAFEIGDPDLDRERSNGIDLSLRQQDERVEAELNLFYYDIHDFVFLDLTGEVEDGLLVGNYLQGDSRFVGTEFDLGFALHETLWFKMGVGFVDAELTDTSSDLPRIPPLRGTLGFDFRKAGFSFSPEWVLAKRQDSVSSFEVPTAGYGVVNLKASYTMPRQHFVHHFAVDVFNVGDKLHRNHVSLIKDLAPEMGRGVKFSYVVKFF